MGVAKTAQVKAAINQPIAKLFELPLRRVSRGRTVHGKIKTEILFIERCLDLLKPGGRMGIVLPEGICNNPSLLRVRQFVEDRAYLKAVVSLPQETFISSGASVTEPMSEYQYYEFLSIDRPLTADEMAELRALSTRATITPVSFTNEYNWGDFKGNPDKLMQRYFDAHVYVAKAVAVPYLLEIKATKTHWIITWSLEESENYDRFGMEDGRGWMARLIRMEKQKRDRKQREIKRRGKRKTYLKDISSDFPKAWASVREPVERGSGRGYDEACRILVDIAEAYALFATKKQFQKELEKFMAGHLRRRALIQRLVKAGIWKEE